MTNSIYLNFLGSLQIHDEHNQPRLLRQRKEEALLAYLAVEHQHAHSRDSLTGLFWPDSPTEKARLSLRVTLSHLKKQLKSPQQPSLWRASQRDIQFVLDGCQLDVVAFGQALHSGEGHDHRRDELCDRCHAEVARAVSLYRGDFLAGLFLDRCQLFDEWLFMQRERFRVQVLEALTKLTHYHYRRLEADLSLHYAQRQLEIDPLRETAHQQIMQIHLSVGRRNDALRQFEICRQMLHNELGVNPSKETLELHHQAVSLDETFRQTTPIAADAVQIHANLPHFATPFIGRQDELALLRERMAEGAYRLITLVGAGGMGKTRLAVEAARQQRPHFADGVYFVPFAGVIDPEAVVTTLAAALGITFHEGEQTAQQQLLAWLRPRRALLVLDNLEHLPSMAGLLVEMLHSAPQVIILATSREALGLQAEDLIGVTGLEVPTTEDLANAPHYPSVRLFVDRAHRVDKGFRLSAENVADVVLICRLLEGRPLGLELAAVHTAHQSCRAIADAIVADLDFLAVDLPELPARQRSLRAVFEQSWQALTPAEQRVFAQLSVFQSYFTIDSAIAVTGASLPILTRLSNTHLIDYHDDEHDDGYSQRFRIHELLRQFAADKLAELLPNRSALEQRHAEYFLAWLRRQDQILRGIQPRRCAETIQAVLNDIEAAWQWASAAQAVDLLAQALPVLASFYSLRGMNSVAERSLLATLAQLPAKNKEMRAQLLVRLGAVLEKQGKIEAAAAATDQGLALAEKIGDHHSLAIGRMTLAFLCRTTGSVVDSIKIVKDALAALPEGEHLDLRVSFLIFLATQETESGNVAASDAAYAEARCIVAVTGNKVQAQALLFYATVDRLDDDEVAARRTIEQALSLCPDTGNRTLETHILIALGFLHARMGNYAEAIAYHHRGLAICTTDHEPIQQSYILHNLCADHYNIGDYDEAYGYGREALEIALRNDLLDGIAYAQMHLGHVLAEMHCYEDARQALNHAQEIFLQMERTMNLVEVDAGLAQVERLMGNLSAALAHVDAVYPHLVPSPIPLLDEPSRVYLHCYQVLAAAKDNRAQDILGAAYRYLQTRAARLDPEDRARFLSAVPANRAILAAWGRGA